MTDCKRLAEQALEQGGGILRLAPTWVPRAFCRPGKRIKLHPDDYFVLGQRGGIDERWFSSTTWAENGPGTPQDEGLSYVVVDEEGKEKVLLRDVVDLLGAEVIGETLWNKYHRWAMFSKFFDNAGPLPHHIHHRDQHAARVGASGKPEMYFFPSQLNNHGGEFPFTFFGFNPETTKEEVLESLKRFPKGDNSILSLAMAYKLDLDTGWDVPPGVMHAPGSLCTYEPQFAFTVSDKVTNEGYKKVRHMILYHCNIGYPILSPDSEVYIPAIETKARNAHAQEGIECWMKTQAADQDYEEMCYYHTLKPDADNHSTVAIYNPNLDLGIAIEIDLSTLDHFVQWKMMGAGDYVMGLEPGNSTIDGIADAVENGSMKYLDAGESVEYHLTFHILKGREELEAIKNKLK